jgi:hypothetical protein
VISIDTEAGERGTVVVVIATDFESFLSQLREPNPEEFA